MKVTTEKLDERISKCTEGVKDKAGAELRQAKKKLKRAQRKKRKITLAVKRVEEKSKKKDKASSSGD